MPIKRKNSLVHFAWHQCDSDAGKCIARALTITIWCHDVSTAQQWREKLTNGKLLWSDESLEWRNATSCRLFKMHKELSTLMWSVNLGLRDTRERCYGVLSLRPESTTFLCLPNIFFNGVSVNETSLQVRESSFRVKSIQNPESNCEKLIVLYSFVSRRTTKTATLCLLNAHVCEQGVNLIFGAWWNYEILLIMVQKATNCC